jgi:hypothetical protein
MNFVAMAIGAFYVLAGLVVLRSMMMSQLLDKALAAITLKHDRKEEMRTRVLSVGALLTLASGAGLAILSPLALPLFAANAAVQGGYLVWAERDLKPEDESEARGRKQTKNAYVIYLAATAFVIWCAAQGVLRPWSAGWQALAIDVVIVAAVTVGLWAFIHRPRRRAPSTYDDDEAPADDATHDDDPAPPYNPPPFEMPKRLRFAPEWNCHPLWDIDTGNTVSPWLLPISQDLMARIEEWDDTWQATYVHDDPRESGFKNDADYQAYLKEGRELAAELKKAWAGELEIREEFR